MQTRVLPLMLPLAVACGRDPGPTRAEHEALLQRLDAMEQRIDALEDAPRPPAPAEPSRSLPDDDRLVPPRPAIVTEAAVEPAAPSLHIHLRVDGLRLDGEAVTEDEARARFEATVRERPDTRLVVLAEPEVSHAQTVRVLDLAHAAGLKDIAMSARVRGADPDPP